MKKILIKNDLIIGGGVENVMFNLVTYLDKKGYDITVSADYTGKKEFYSVYPKNVKYVKYKLRRNDAKRGSLSWLINRVLVLIYKYIRKIRLNKKYDIAIAMKEGFAMKEILEVSADKRFAWVHVDYHSLHWTKCVFASDEEERSCFEKFDKTVCVSQAAANSLAETIGNPGNLCVKYNPIDYKSIIEKSNQPCGFKRQGNGLLFVSVGRLDAQKNYSLLVDVCAKLSQKYAFELWIAGEGEERGSLEEKIKLSALEGCIKLIGHQNNPYPIIKTADCFVSCSVRESFGLAVQEALVLQIPVVSTKCPAIEEVLNPKCALLCSNDFNGLYSAMEEILKNPSMLDAYRNNISLYYKIDDLYEKRLDDICRLWV